MFMRRIVIKEGPLVFLRNVLLMEIGAGVVLFLLSFLQNYELLYESLGLIKILRYDLFLIIAFSIFQLVYVTSMFLNWYFSYFEITTNEITKKTGLLFRRKRSVNLSNVVSIDTYQSPLSRMIKHSTIILNHSDDKVTKIKNVADAEEYLHIIKQMVGGASSKNHLTEISSLIKKGENFLTEFKESLRYDTRKNETSKEMERVILKTITGFLNANGGTLLIGVKDDGEVVGLERDFETLQKKNADGFENHLSMLVKTNIGMNFAKYINIKFEKLDKKEICMVNVEPGHKPAYLQSGDKKEEFFVRVGNSTQPFSMSEAEEYIKNHWK